MKWRIPILFVEPLLRKASHEPGGPPFAVSDIAARLGESRVDEEQIAQAILNYLGEHPNAMDTLQGIADWWLQREQVRVTIEMLARVLSRLTASGQLEEIGEGTTRCYRRKA
jgi:hypothetical protein